MKPGVIDYLPYKVHIYDIKQGWHHNPTISTDPETHQTWIGIRRHDLLPLTVHLDPDNPHANEPSRFEVGRFDPTTLAVSDLHRITPIPDSPPYLHSHNVEDVRIFHRYDGLHGIGVAFPDNHITQVEILIDYQTSTYKLLHDFGQPNGHTEKNWQAPSIPTEMFDFIYSPTEVVKYGRPRGSYYAGGVHGGSQLLPYQDGWISIAHKIVPVVGLTKRWYVSLAQLHDQTGFVTHQSQFFDFGSGWRENLQESVEFVSGAIWLDDQETLLLSLGVRDETCGFVRVPVTAFNWQPVGGWYKDFSLHPELDKIVKSHAPKKSKLAVV